MKPIVVVPTYNEIENLQKITEFILEQPGGFHILIVDDNSPDGTGKLADDLSSRHQGRVFVLHRARKEGLGRAYVEAFELVLRTMPHYDAILQMDADLSHDPASLPEFLNLLKQHHVVLGSRYLHGVNVLNWDFKRLLLSKGASVYVRAITGMPYSDPTGGFKAWRREALNSIRLDRLFSNGYLFQIETTYRAHRTGTFSIGELSIVFRDRDLGRSKIDVPIILEAVWGVIRLRLTGR
jgi:dolichol-phosphate mannosyltransferase